MLKIFLAGGTLLMLAVMLLAGRDFHIPLWKHLVAAVLLAAAGVAGAQLMYLLENGAWGGRSFFGAVFFPPVVMLPAAMLLKVRSSRLMDLCAPAECVMLALLKVQCMIDGCCGGRLLGITAGGEAIVFPSQIAECVNALIIMLVLILFIRSGRSMGRAYPAYLIIYGATRFILNLMRDAPPFIRGLPIGNIWSVLSVVLGLIAWFLTTKHIKTSLEGA